MDSIIFAQVWKECGAILKRVLEIHASRIFRANLFTVKTVGLNLFREVRVLYLCVCVCVCVCVCACVYEGH